MAKDWKKPRECRQPEFGELVRLWREQQGLTQKEVANMIGVDETRLRATGNR